MRLVLYNMRYGTGGGFILPWQGYLRRTSLHVQSISDFLMGLQPDIVGLIEVDAGSFRHRREHQAESIASRLGHYHCYESKYDAGSLWQRVPVINKQGNAFLTKDSIRHQQFHFFEKGMKRLVIELELEGITVFLVHLALKFRVRHHQMMELYNMVKTTDKPHLVIGDFNVFRGKREAELFLAATKLQSANVEGLPTFPSWRPRQELDFVFYSEGINISDLQVPPVTFSDHLPVVCDFDLNER